MKVASIFTFGAPDVITVNHVETPTPSESQVLIKVKSAGVNPIDAKIRAGTSFAAKEIGKHFPFTLGFDVCGEIEECGDDVTNFKVGDKVIGHIGLPHKGGAYGQYCLANSCELVKVDGDLSADMGGIPTVGLTAWQAVNNHGNLQAGETVLIQAGGGGVGHLAVQIAKAKGAKVIATAGTDDLDYVKSLGADQVIDYMTQDFSKEVSDVDLVIDLVGGETGVKSLYVLKQNGRIVTVPTITAEQIITAAQQIGISATGMLADSNMEDLANMCKLIKDGDVKLRVGKTFPLDEAEQAHELLEQGRAKGKIILDCA